ncbi:MAG: discoidin domain-containing protein [Spirochaetes bacterium]|nr:discoidin domain-containing protein [Spirochaetota bacterium]
MKKSKSKIKLFSKMFLLICIFSTTLLFPFSIWSENISIINAVASSYENDTYNAGKAVDGNMYTRWSSNFTSTEWIYVDLGEIKLFDNITLEWEAAYGKTYKIQTSNNASTWTDIYSTSDGNGNIDNINVSVTSSRYIRMYATERGIPGCGYSLYEFSVLYENQDECDFIIEDFEDGIKNYIINTDVTEETSDAEAYNGDKSLKLTNFGGSPVIQLYFSGPQDWRKYHSISMRVHGSTGILLKLKDKYGRCHDVATKTASAGQWNHLLFNIQATLDPTNCWDLRYDKQYITEMQMYFQSPSGDVYLDYIMLTE